jgi:hypothetical protein
MSDDVTTAGAACVVKEEELHLVYMYSAAAVPIAAA